MANLDLFDKKNFTVFLVVDIVLTVAIAVSGIFLFPFFAWLISSGFAVMVILIVLTSVSTMLLITWSILSIVKRSRYRKRGKYEKMSLPYPILFILALSMICINAINLPIFINGPSFHTRWGDCLVNGYEIYSMFGIKKHDLYEFEMNGFEVDQMYKVRCKGNKRIIAIYYERIDDGKDWHYYEDERFDCYSVRMDMYAMMYDDTGEYIGDIEGDTFYYCDLLETEKERLKQDYGLICPLYFYDGGELYCWDNAKYLVYSAEHRCVDEYKNQLRANGCFFVE